MTRKFWNLKMERFSTITPSYLSAFFKFAKFELKKIFQIKFLFQNVWDYASPTQIKNWGKSLPQI